MCLVHFRLVVLPLQLIVVGSYPVRSSRFPSHLLLEEKIGSYPVLLGRNRCPTAPKVQDLDKNVLKFVMNLTHL
jgi:hypothetical protein